MARSQTGLQAHMSATICGHEKSSHQGARTSSISNGTIIATAGSMQRAVAAPRRSALPRVMPQAWQRVPLAESKAGITSDSCGSTRRQIAIVAPVAAGAASTSSIRIRVEGSASMARFCARRAVMSRVHTKCIQDIAPDDPVKANISWLRDSLPAQIEPVPRSRDRSDAEIAVMVCGPSLTSIDWKVGEVAVMQLYRYGWRRRASATATELPRYESRFWH